MLTALLPVQHGALFARKSAISSGAPTLAELLKAQGYSTASFNGGGQISAQFGFSRGFDIYQSYAGTDYQHERFIERVKEAIAWLEERSPEKFFLFLHSYEVHSPYAPADHYLAPFQRAAHITIPRFITADLLDRINRKHIKISEADHLFIVDSYDGEIRSMDHGWQVLIDFLKASGRYEQSLIIFTSDHGEEFGEHGKIGLHSHTLYDELLKLPLIIKLPYERHAGLELASQVRSIDIAPTVLDMLAVPQPKHFAGQSLLQLIEGGGDFNPFAVSQRDSKREPLPTSIRTARWKLYKGKLFDLERDPTEQLNLAKQMPQVAFELQERIDRILRLSPVSPGGRLEPHSHTLRQLKTLGYVN